MSTWTWFSLRKPKWCLRLLKFFPLWLTVGQVMGKGWEILQQLSGYLMNLHLLLYSLGWWAKGHNTGWGRLFGSSVGSSIWIHQPPLSTSACSPTQKLPKLNCWRVFLTQSLIPFLEIKEWCWKFPPFNIMFDLSANKSPSWHYFGPCTELLH